MRKITAVESISLDGVMQAPGRPDEDERGGFAHGGWAVPYAADPVQGRVIGGHMQGESDLLFGRRTYEDFHRSWAGRTDNPFSPRLDAGRKYVVSTTLDRAADLGELRAASRRRRGQGAARRARGSRSWAAASCCGPCSPRTSSTSCCCSCTRSCSAPVSGCSPPTVRMPGCGWWTPRRPARAS